MAHKNELINQHGSTFEICIANKKIDKTLQAYAPIIYAENLFSKPPTTNIK